MKVTAKIILRQGSQEAIDNIPTPAQTVNLLKLEQYLNNDIASEVFKRFNIGLQVHLSEK